MNGWKTAFALACVVLFTGGRRPQSPFDTVAPEDLEQTAAIPIQRIAPPDYLPEGVTPWENIRYFYPNAPYFFYDTPTGFPGQWHLHNQSPGGGPDANLAGASARGATFTREVLPREGPWGPGKVFQILGPRHGQVVGEVTGDSGLMPGDYTQVYLPGSWTPVIGWGDSGPWVYFVVFPVPVEGPISIYTFDPDAPNAPASYNPVNGDLFHLILTGESYTYLPWIEGGAIHPKAELAFADLDSLFNFDNAPLAQGLSWRPVVTATGDLDLLVVPEPGTLVMVLGGGLGLLLLLWRRREKAAGVARP